MPHTSEETADELRNHRNLLGDALGRVLVAIGMVRKDAQLTGPELLLAAETYLESNGGQKNKLDG